VLLDCRIPFLQDCQLTWVNCSFLSLWIEKHSSFYFIESWKLISSLIKAKILLLHLFPFPVIHFLKLKFSLMCYVEQDGNVYSLVYTAIPKALFSPHHVGHFYPTFENESRFMKSPVCLPLCVCVCVCVCVCGSPINNFLTAWYIFMIFSAEIMLFKGTSMQ
jgi:hypothetical protein